MPVYQDSGPGIGEALISGLQTFANARRQKRADEQFEADMADRLAARNLQRAQLGQQGIHLLGQGEMAPTWLPKAVANDATSRMAIPDAPELAFSPEGGAPTMQPKMPTGRAAAGAANIPNRPASMSGGGDLFQQTLAANLGGMPNRGPRYEVGQGYWLDKQPQWDAQDATMARTQNEKLFEATIQGLLADQALGRSKDLSQFNAKVDIGKEGALAPIRTAQAVNTERALAPIRTQQAIETERGLSPIRTQTAVATARGTAPIEIDKALRIAQGEQPMKLELAEASRNANNGLTPAQANEVKLRQTALLNMHRAVAALRDAVEQGGTAVMPGEYRAKIAALQANARIQYKEAANLGAISGSDLQLINDALGSATSPQQSVLGGGKKGVLSSLDVALQSIRDRGQTMKQVYGVDIPGLTGDGASTVPAAGGDTAGTTITVNGKTFKVPN